jgi:hypothetical protein
MVSETPAGIHPGWWKYYIPVAMRKFIFSTIVTKKTHFEHGGKLAPRF